MLLSGLHQSHLSKSKNAVIKYSKDHLQVSLRRCAIFFCIQNHSPLLTQ